MSHFVRLIVAFLAVFASYVSAFTVKKTILRNSFSLNVTPGSYSEMLQRAKLAKAQKNGSIPPSVASAISSPTAAALSAMQTSNSLPFSDEMYDNFKYVIEKLSGRMKSNGPLSVDALDGYKAAVEAIIADSKSVSGAAKAVPPTPKVASTTAAPVAAKVEEVEVKPEKQDGDDDNSSNNSKKEAAFDALKGLKSTWEIPGSERMTTEEYYAAVNKRISDMKKKRRELEGNPATIVQDYFDSLSRPRKTETDGQK